ncbi:MAG: DUF6653 family protein [Pseudomonadota bacterium]
MTGLFERIEGLMGMDDRVWARHANPFSVYTRILSGPLIFLAFWSVFWIGFLGLGLIAFAVLWIWANPRLFPPPKDTESWATKGVLGERVFLNRKAVPIPIGHGRAAYLTTAFAIGFVVITVYGFLTRDFITALAGWHGALVAKLWFVDRMAWLWEEMRAMHPVYTAWDRADWTASLEQNAAHGQNKNVADEPQ